MGWIDRARALALLALGFFSAPTLVYAQTSWPDQPVRMVVPFPAGGPADILARMVAERLGEKWRQPVIIDNRPGANTAVAAVHVAKLAPDGYTLFVVMDVTMVLNPITTKNLPYDPIRDFAPITLLSKNTSLLMVRAEDGPKTVAELIAIGKANPGKLNFGAGIITTRLAAEFFNRETGIVAQYVPFQGSPPTVQGLLNKSVDYIVDGAASSLPMIKGGKFRALAKTNNGAIPALPELRSLAAETGLPRLEDISTWIGLVAPTATPPAIIDKVQNDVAEIYADQSFIDRAVNAGLSPFRSTSNELRGFISSETARWDKVVKEAGIDLN